MPACSKPILKFRRRRRAAAPIFVGAAARRRGGVYIAVLGAAMLVSMIGLCAMHVARVELRGARQRDGVNTARSLAQSGIEFALASIDLDPNWRDNIPHNTERPLFPISLDGGKVTFKLIDLVDGNLATGANDPVVIYGIGRSQGSTLAYKAQYEINGQGAFQLVPGSWSQTTLAP